MFSAHFIADLFLDHIRYSRYVNISPVSGEPMKMLEI